ncbi:MAG: hypothetical protein ACTSO7_17575 [Candidatus Heimdallarchaeota archaeon]
MSKQIGSVLARTFREECEKSNKNARKEFSKISTAEITKIETLLKKVDNENFDLESSLGKILGVTEK